MKKSNFLKFTCGLLAAMLLASCFAAAASALSFKDVKKGAWYYSAVTFAVEQGLMNGVGDGNFSPGGSATRAMLVTLLHRMEGEPKVSAKTPFTDLKSDWYKAPIAWAYANKIVNGTSGTTFSPTGPLTREQFATILYRYCKEYLLLDVGANAQLSGYPDHKSVSNYAKDAMIWAIAEELITGANEGGTVYLRPKQTATRAQMATIFQRFDAYRERQEQQEEPPAEQPCDFGGEPYHTYGTMGKQSKHFYLCRENGCTKTKEVPCTIQIETNPASCKEYGSINYSCAVCGYNQTIVDSSVLPIGHQMGKAIHQESEEGEHSHAAKCQNCSYTVESPCTVAIKNKTASCTENGGIRHTCSGCNYNEWFPDESQQPLGHRWGAYTSCEEAEGAAPAHFRRCTNAGCSSTVKSACTIVTTKTMAAPGKNGTINYACKQCKYKESVSDPNAPARPYEEGTYKVITYNLKAMYYDPLTGGTKDQRENVAALLKLFDADIIGLQEVDNNNSRSWHYDQAKYLADALGYEYYFCATVEGTKGGKAYKYGTAILSRYPIKTAQKVDYATQSGEHRAYSRAVIQFPESDVVFYNTHLCTGSSGSTTGAAARQFNEVIGAVCTETLPTLLTGDFNLHHSVREQLYDKSKVMSLNAVNYDSALPIDDIYIRNAEYYVDSESGRGLFLVREDYSDHEMAYGCFKLE